MNRTDFTCVGDWALEEQTKPAEFGKSDLGVSARWREFTAQRAVGDAEELGGAARDFLSAAMTLGSLSRELRLLIRLAVANVHRCRYCTAHQRHQLIELGVLDAKIAAVVAPDSGGLTARERAAVRFAQATTIDAGAIPPAVYAEFVAEFTPQERVEVTIVASAMGMLNKINDALRVPLEAEFEELVS